ncbi:MAG: DUF2974 domain-containing protein [Clostridiales bacterium]|nr:DUF2974 domain-containing protein [Clostridiales bacterium]
MADLHAYMEEKGAVSLAETPFNAVDSLVFAQLSYIEFDKATGFSPCSLAEAAQSADYGVRQDDNRRLLSLAAAQPRFRDSLVFGYVSEFSQTQTKQFSAVTFLLPDGTAYVAFRGTDSTIVGWKEDFMLTFTTPVPAQARAAEYLNRVAALIDAPLRVGGHSKGGNLAVYASAFCENDAQKRIIQVYSHDGPGFDEDTLAMDGYLAVKQRIQRYIPVSSMVGMMMEQDSALTVVDSSAQGLAQHNPFTWRIQDWDFVKRDRLGFAGLMISRGQKEWFRLMSEDRRRYMTDTLFDILSAANPHTLQDLTRDKSALLKSAAALVKLPQEDRHRMWEIAKTFISCLYQGSGYALKTRLDELARRAGEGDEEKKA